MWGINKLLRVSIDGTDSEQPVHGCDHARGNQPAYDPSRQCAEGAAEQTRGRHSGRAEPGDVRGSSVAKLETQILGCDARMCKKSVYELWGLAGEGGG